jgi:hypothetical protein
VNKPVHHSPSTCIGRLYIRVYIKATQREERQGERQESARGKNIERQLIFYCHLSFKIGKTATNTVAP